MSHITFICNKLARDKTLETLAAADITAQYKMLSSAELRSALRNKLLEEAHEVADTVDRKELVSELADVLEVVEGLRKAYGIPESEILATQRTIREHRGGFEQGLYLESITMSEDNPDAAYFKKYPEKYKMMRS